MDQNPHGEASGVGENTQAVQQYDSTIDNVPVFVENEIFIDISNFVDLTTVTRQQQFLVSLRTQGLSFAAIRSEFQQIFNEKISDEALLTCFKRFAWSFPWMKGTKGGNDTYLPIIDLNELKNDIAEKARLTHAYNAEELLNKAHELKINRRDKAWKVLKILGCEREAEKTRKIEIMPPHRS